jgi:hypothetical protein
MKLACAWCGQDMGQIESRPAFEGRTSHGICEVCSRAFNPHQAEAYAGLPVQGAALAQHFPDPLSLEEPREPRLE